MSSHNNPEGREQPAQGYARITITQADGSRDTYSGDVYQQQHTHSGGAEGDMGYAFMKTRDGYEARGTPGNYTETQTTGGNGRTRGGDARGCERGFRQPAITF